MVAKLETVRIALLVAQQNGRKKVEMQLDIKAIAACLQTKKYPALEASIIAEDIFLLSNIF